MQKKFVLKKKTKVETIKGDKRTLTYTPDDFDEKEIAITFKDEEIAEQMGMPTETIGDSAIVEFGAKEIQSKLVINDPPDDDQGKGEDDDE
jgi:hypothetical protein